MVDLIKADNFISVDISSKYSIETGDWTPSHILSIDMLAIRKGLIKQLNTYGMAVYLAIASFSNEDGTNYPSPRVISDVTGISEKKVKSIISELLETKIYGIPVIEQTTVANSKGTNTKVYHLS